MTIEGSQPLPADNALAPAPSLRETLTTAYEAVEKAAPPAPVAEVPGTAPPEPGARAAAAVETPAPAAAPKTDAAGRLHAPDGKFASKEPAAPEPVAAPEPQLQRPSSWKKDHWPLWDKLVAGQALSADEAKTLARYTNEREGDFVKGVSTYKQEWDRARPVLEALHPYRDLISGANATPEQFIKMAGDTHQILSRGSPQEKLREIARFASAYGVPLHELFVQGEDGKLYQNQTYFQAQQPPQQQQALSREDIKKEVAQELAQAHLKQQVQQFQEAKDASGNPQYPHYNAVWKTMGGILRAGLAQDLPTAYKVALTLPQHADLSPAAPQANAQDEAAKKAAAAETARKARANAVSPKTEAHTNLIPTGNGKRDGLRATLESAFNQHLSGGGRV